MREHDSRRHLGKCRPAFDWACLGMALAVRNSVRPTSVPEPPREPFMSHAGPWAPHMLAGAAIAVASALSFGLDELLPGSAIALLLAFAILVGALFGGVLTGLLLTVAALP